MRYLHPFFGIILLLFPLSARAGVEECDHVLVMDHLEQRSSSSQDSRLSSLVDATSYAEAHQKYGAAAVIYGVPVSATYDSYHQSATSNLSVSEQESHQKESREIAWSGLSAEGRQVYETCLSHIKNQSLALTGGTPDSTGSIVFVGWPSDVDPPQITWSCTPSPCPANWVLPPSIPRGGIAVPLLTPPSDVMLAISRGDNQAGPTPIKISATPPKPPQYTKYCSIEIDQPLSYSKLSQHRAVCTEMKPGATVNAFIRVRLLPDPMNNVGMDFIQMNLLVQPIDNSHPMFVHGDLLGWPAAGQAAPRQTVSVLGGVVPNDGNVALEWACNGNPALTHCGIPPLGATSDLPGTIDIYTDEESGSLKTKQCSQVPGCP
jgi:hypothetical protein